MEYVKIASVFEYVILKQNEKLLWRQNGSKMIIKSDFLIESRFTLTSFWRYRDMLFCLSM